jgi:hypothetical protein
MNWKGCGRKRSRPSFRYYPGICVEGLRKSTKILSQHTQYPDWDSNQASSYVSQKQSCLAVQEFMRTSARQSCHVVYVILLFMNSTFFKPAICFCCPLAWLTLRSWRWKRNAGLSANYTALQSRPYHATLESSMAAYRHGQVEGAHAAWTDGPEFRRMSEDQLFFRGQCWDNTSD